jgi:hypothetical protein
MAARVVLLLFVHGALRCKRHAAAALPGAAAARRAAHAKHCCSVEQSRVASAQGQPGVRARLVASALALALACSSVPAACPGPELRLEPLAPGLWWVPAADDGDADGSNRGHVSHLLVAEDGARLWLVGSGPTPAFGRSLACQVRQRVGRAPTDVISPWPRPELVLGLAGLGGVRSWSHADVARAMRRQCPGCVARLRQRLGDAAGDLGEHPVRVPTRLLHGSSGRLGPWRWWRYSRGPGFAVTVWQLTGTDVRFAPGLLWGGGVPDGRDAHIATLAAATQALAHRAGGTVRWVGEQGPLPDAEAARGQALYWARLIGAVRAAQARGDTDTGTPPPIEGLTAGQAADPRHALNWQRVWRQEEAAASAAAAAASGPQRSLR